MAKRMPCTVASLLLIFSLSCAANNQSSTQATVIGLSLFPEVVEDELIDVPPHDEKSDTAGARRVSRTAVLVIRIDGGRYEAPIALKIGSLDGGDVVWSDEAHPDKSGRSTTRVLLSDTVIGKSRPGHYVLTAVSLNVGVAEAVLRID